MYVTFKNNSTSETMLVSVENQRYIIKPETSVQVFCQSEKVVFETQAIAFDELEKAIDELNEEVGSSSFKDRVLAKLTKKFVEKLPEAILDISIKYEASFINSQSAIVNLYESTYSVCDGKIADFFDIMPVGFMFSRAETENEKIKVLDAVARNHKKFLKLMRKILLFINWGLIFVKLFLFVPEYLIIMFFSSHFFIKQLFCSLYNKSANKRASILHKKEQCCEKETECKGCLSDIIKGLIVFLIIAGLCFWANTNDPYVIISEDFSSVECFDELFVKIGDGLPLDAKDVFLEEYSAYYPLSDGGYDMDNYYCYIYETPDGTRYMWIKDNCSNKENADKDYEDYKNPLVYKSIGEVE